MGNLMSLAIYNPAILSDEELLDGFVARRDLASRLLARLKEIGAEGLASHHLILGQRGMGKTTLLRRLALGVRNDLTLSSVLMPLTFREEQYNVHNLHVLWCNCLDALGDWFEKSEQPAKAAKVDEDVAALGQREMDPEGEAAKEAFQSWARREQRRPLLLLDNVDVILDGLAKQQWTLRRALQEAGGVVVMGASTAYLETTTDPQAAFYDFFQVTVLEPIPSDELLSSLRHLAEARGPAGRPVLQVLGSDPGRIRALHALTGGNPRTLVLLYMLLEAETGEDVMADLEHLLDQVTVLYKARVEDLAPQARVVLDGVALHWDPATAADLAGATGLDVGIVSSQLDRLVKTGILEKVGVSTTPRAAFQVSERFFNIWYLMRHGPRRQRARLRWLTEFLRGFYTPRQLTDLGRIDEAEAAYRRAISLDDRFVPPWINLGNLLADHLGRYGEAESAYREALKRDPDNPLSALQLVRMQLMQPDRLADAEETFEYVASKAAPDRAALLRALHAMARDNLSEATGHLWTVLQSPPSEVFKSSMDDVLGVLRLAAARGHGDKVLSWMDQRGISNRYWPMRAAYEAFLHGEEKLRDVNPELRSVASWLLDWLDTSRKGKTATMSAAGPAKRPRRPRRGTTR